MNQTPATPDKKPPTPLEELVSGWGMDELQAIYPDTHMLEALRVASESGDVDAFDMLIGDATKDFLLNNSREFNDNIKTVRSRSTEESKRLEARNRQRALIALAREAISKTAGAREEHAVDQEYWAREKITSILLEAKSSDGEAFNPLRTLGFVQRSDDGEERFRFPKEIMPVTTIAKWQAYIDAVKAHLKTEGSLRSGLTDKGELMRADLHRKVAHDSVTRDLADLLGVDDFEEMRRTVAKMRDGSFPNTATNEEARVNKTLKEGLTVSTAMRHHLFPEGEYLFEPNNQHGD